MENETIKDRLVKAFNQLRFFGKVSNQTDFGAKLGYNKSHISEIFTGRKPITTPFLNAMRTKFGINEEWMLSGEGSMTVLIGLEDLNSEIKLSGKKEVIALGKHVPTRLKPEDYAAAFGDWPGLPMFNAPITASFIETYRDEKIMRPQYYLHDPRFKDCDFGAIITGDSMHSEIRHGDFVVCQQVFDTRFIVFGDIYYVLATNGLETCKYLNAGKDEYTLMLNPKNEKISPSPIPKDMIAKLYKVRGIVRGY